MIVVMVNYPGTLLIYEYNLLFQNLRYCVDF